MTAKEFLVKARALIRKGWTQGPFAEDRKGHTVPANSRKACRWCAMGSLLSVDGRNAHATKTPSQAYFQAKRALYLAIEQEGLAGHDLVTFNEAPGRKKSQVLKVFGAAIRGLRGQGS